MKNGLFFRELFSECFQTKETTPELSFIDYTLWYTKIKNLHTTGKLESEKTYVLCL